MTVNVMDTNDEAPQFSLPGYNKTISEGDKAGTSIVTVSAKDEDLVTKCPDLEYDSYSLVERQLRE